MWYCVLVCQLNALRLQLRSEGLHLVRMEILSAGDIALGKRTFEKFYSAGTLKDIDVLTWDEDYQPKMDVKVCNDEMETVEYSMPR
jgi:hypothetical protein